MTTTFWPNPEVREQVTTRDPTSHHTSARQVPTALVVAFRGHNAKVQVPVGRPAPQAGVATPGVPCQTRRRVRTASPELPMPQVPELPSRGHRSSGAGISRCDVRRLKGNVGRGPT